MIDNQETSKPDHVVINEAITQAVNSHYRIAGERDNINEIVKSLKEKFGLKPKTIRNAIKAAYKSNAAEVESETEEVIDLLERAKLLSRTEE